MIRAVVLDIDGVIIGDKRGVNFPDPSRSVKQALRTIHDSGVPVSLLSAKPAFTAYQNIKSVGIDGPHIAASGGVIFNPLRDQIIRVTSIKQDDILHLLKVLPKNICIYLFGTEEYYLQQYQKSAFVDRYAEFAGSYPVIVDDFKEIIKNDQITKINIIAFSEEEKSTIAKLMGSLSSKYNLAWGSAPVLAPTQIMVVTAKGISKRSGVKYMAHYLKIPLDEILGVGDTILDWDFLEICGYKAVMENASDELKAKIDLSDPRQMIAGHVNNDGVLDVFRHFNLRMNYEG